MTGIYTDSQTYASCFHRCSQSHKQRINNSDRKRTAGSIIKIFVNGPEKGSTTTKRRNIHIQQYKLKYRNEHHFAKSYDAKEMSASSEFLVINYDRMLQKLQLKSQKTEIQSKIWIKELK